MVGGGPSLALSIALCCSAGPLHAQQEGAAVDSVGGRAAGIVAPRISPGAAFLRSMVVPGWGQAATGAYSRAAFYITAEAASALMLVKTQRLLSEAQVVRRERRSRALSALFPGVGPIVADSMDALAEADPSVEDAALLEDSRGQQREDWLAFGLFMLFLGGADAFVSAHLADFPEPLSVEIRPLPGPELGAEVGVRIPWPIR